MKTRYGVPVGGDELIHLATFAPGWALTAHAGSNVYYS